MNQLDDLRFSLIRIYEEQQQLLPFAALTITLLIGILTASTYLRSRRYAAIDIHLDLPPQCAPDWQGEILQNPSIKVSGSPTIQCFAPATGALLGTVLPLTPSAIDRAISRAAEAQAKWCKTSFDERRQVLRTLRRYILKNQQAIARIACLDSGKTRVDACFGEILVTLERIRWTLKYGERCMRTEVREGGGLLMLFKRSEVRYESLGVVAAAVSWNYPFHNLLGPAITTLFTGSAILLKPSEQTAWSSQFFTSILRACLTAHGHFPQLVQCTPCWPATAGHLTSHPQIRHLTFIGSRPIAHLVAQSAAKSLTPLCVELGGKDAAILLGDLAERGGRREVERVVSILMRGVFQSAGQNCIGIERVIVVSPSLYETVVEMLRQRIAKLTLGDDLDAGNGDTPVDVGAMISAARFDELEALISDAVRDGARCLVGGTRYAHPLYPSGSYFQPTLLADVTPSMRIASTETFAPIALVMAAKDGVHAVEIANSAPFGLGASVFGHDTRECEEVVKRLKVGMVAVNDFAVSYLCSLPFGGVRESGYGRFSGVEGVRSLCAVKSVCVDGWGGWIKTVIPKVLDLPLPKGGREKAERMGRGLAELGFAEGLGEFLSGLRKMM